MNYYPWVDDDEDDSFAWITRESQFLLDDMRSFQLCEGMPVASWFRPDSPFDLSEDYGTKLADHVPNTLGFLMVSAKLRELLERHAGAQIEFLPITLRNQRKQLVKKPYFIANLLGSVDCVDMRRSEFSRSAIRKDQVRRFYHLVLDEKRIGPEDKLFRLSESKRTIVAREDLGKEILRAGCQGMIFQRLEDYGSEFRPV